MVTITMPSNKTEKFDSLLHASKSLDGVRLTDAIPKDLYEPRLARGLLSLSVSYAIYIGAVVATAHVHWAFYLPLWLLAGLGGWGLFCVAHDCGHNSFSRNRKFNHVIGHIALLPLLYPFHGWRHMHNMHHANTNSLELDVDWRPVLRSQYDAMPWWDKLVYGSTRSWLFWLGTVNYQRHSGFRPAMFAKREARNEVRRSILFMAVAALLYLPALVYFTGFTGLIIYFVMPWFAIHAWFSVTTMMHHISEDTPFLTREHWTSNASRLLVTTDYTYPKWLLFLTHYISVHTAHHVAPVIPHYNLPKAQTALKKAFPGMVREKPMSVRALWRVARHCHLYDPVDGFYEAFDAAAPAGPSQGKSTPPADLQTLTTKQRLLRTYMTGLSAISVGAAGRKATDLFGYTREYIKAPTKEMNALGASRFAIPGIHGTSYGYRWGHGDHTILLVHGWGTDSRSLYALIRPLQQLGYSVAAFDAPAHGMSPGSLSTMTEFKDAVKAAILALGNVTGIVAHSLGGIATTGALSELAGAHGVEAICLVGAPADLPTVIRRWANGFLRLNRRTVEAMHVELHARNGVPVEHWNIPQLASRLHRPVLVLHDVDDPVVPFCEAQRIAELLPEAQLEPVNGLGHVRILSARPVMDRVASFMAEYAPIDTRRRVKI
ncbi:MULTISPECIES: alpha/beta fold hydrolase [unclassified Sphingomonas]|uniref:alpha/beta fold hydrolase n=1 Tax=unclassified Sphingomonas TaxID=196159 RepID=UPI0028605A35|nr:MULTISPECIES: alpha/beta fold hydrolase [unclassified Sphingomonas]MDR6116520.1 omega-6 fatty acid desaturase (delta-12 desaturase) [Sphingomonas sp. SORGH_AS_0789]MDR6149805.1 omega-6 fatty acid desaturase (delta-12 desaturase) [Sphingomonas sp. SORGH_AS_0742]